MPPEMVASNIDKKNDAKKAVDPFANMDEAKLRTLPVVGSGGLRKFIVKNNIFKGISNLKKKELIDDVLVSKWWRDNIISPSKGKPTKKADKPTKKANKPTKDRAKDVADLGKSLKLRQELQRDLRICEDRIKKRDESIIERDDEIKALNLLIKKKVKKSVKKVDENFEEPKKANGNTRSNNLKVSDIEDIMGKSDSSSESSTSVPPPPPLPPPPKTQAEPIATQTEGDEIPTDSSTQTPPPHTEGLITHQEPQKQNVDAGHTIINMYCGGNHHPDYPVPQSVVRHALNINQAPLYQQQDMAEFLRREEQQQTEPSRRAEPKQSLSDIRGKFSKPAKKFEPVKTIKPNKPIDFDKQKKPQITKKVEEEPEKKSAFEDDDEEEEDEVDKIRRIKREEVARETGKSKGKGFSDAFKRRLEEKLGAGKKS